MFKCGWLAGCINIAEKPEIQVMPCCHVDKRDYEIRGKLYNGKDLINGHTLTEMRQSAIKGIPHELCKICVEQEAAGIDSPRLRSNRFFKNKGIIKEKLDPVDVEVIFIKMSNLCNFKCVMCGAGSSHLIAKENQPKNSLIEIDDFYEEQLLDLLPKMKNLWMIQVTGGEPLLHKNKNLKILEKLPRHVRVEYRTNGSVYDEDLVKFLKEFDQVEFIVSLDGIGDVLHYQRPNSNWEQIKVNLEKYNSDNFLVKNTQTVTCFNIHQLPEFIDSTRHLFHYMCFTPIRFPIEYRINMIRPEKLQSIIKSLKTIVEPGDLKNYIKDITKNYLDTPDQKTIDKFWKTAEYMKKYRNVDLQQLIPEMYNHYRR